jgi:flagellin
MKINHNIQALNAYRNLANNHAATAKTLEKLSSGLRINRAADDAAGLAISEKMKSQIRGLDQAERNILDGISLIQTAEGGLSSIQEMAQRMRELAVQAGNDTLTETDRQSIQREIDQIKNGINDIANNTDVNGIRPLTQEVVKPEDPSSGGDTTELDVVFLVDFSSTMTGINGDGNIEAVKGGIEGFVNNLEKSSYDAQVAIVSITKDSIPVTQDFTAFSKNPTTVSQNLSDLQDIASYKTHPYESIEQSIPNGVIGKELGYRENSKKVFVLFTDAPDESRPYGFSQDSAKDAVEGNKINEGFDDDDIPTYIFGFQDYSLDPSNYDEIVNNTGGKMYTTGISTPQEIQDKLQNDLIKDIDSNIGGSNNTQQQGIIYLQVGANKGETFEVELTDARTTALGIDDILVETQEGASVAITKLDNALQQISSERSKYGAYQNALEHLHSNVTNTDLNISAAQSRIADADMAKEMTKFTKNNILNQSAQAMLAQANQMPQGILQLLK